METLIERIGAFLGRRLTRLQNPAPVVAVLRLNGVIGQVGPLRAGLSLARLASAIERAFSLRHVHAVALVINSPGGSPVQSSLIAKRIRQLSAEKSVPVVAFAEDVAASGGYWLACAADEIYADANSIVGSIGVIAAGFGFTDLIDRIGVERRVYTAGERKSMLDPFRPEKPEDVARLTAVQAEIHTSFQNWVSERRAGRLKAASEDLFSGEFWTGSRALELGLIDGIDDLRSAMRRRFGDEVRLRLVTTERRSWLPRLFGGPSSGGMPALLPGAWADDLLGALEARALWNRFGL